MRDIKKIFTFLIALLSSLIFPDWLYTKDNNIIIYTSTDVGYINKKVFGNNVLAYETVSSSGGTKPYYGNSDYGAGVWNPGNKEPVEDVINLAKEAGITALRFPGGCGSHNYDWKNSIGKNKKHFLFGVGEFLKTCDAIGAEPIVTISYFRGDAKNAADFVEYLNSPNNGSNPNGDVDWASERAKNGRELPFNVEYFEIGNEVYHGNDRDLNGISPETYALEYVKYYDAMKSVDPTSKVGLVLYTNDWNRKAMEIVREKLDFGIMHIYPTPVWGKGLETMSAEKIYKISFALPIINEEDKIRNTLKLLRDKSGRDIPLVISEYNGGFVQEKPVPYRHCLGSALLNAELLRIFMKPENNILMANYWNFINEYWGMATNGFSGDSYDLHRHYRKRPNYYTFELYHKHFGDMLLKADVGCGTYDVFSPKDMLKNFWKNISEKQLGSINSVPYLSVNASRSADGKKIYLMVINKNLVEKAPSAVILKDFLAKTNGDAWVLNGPTIDATNENNPKNVHITHTEFNITNDNHKYGSRFVITFEPHSLTALEINKAD